MTFITYVCLRGLPKLEQAPNRNDSTVSIFQLSGHGFREVGSLVYLLGRMVAPDPGQKLSSDLPV
jgi:hypothetical protein